MDENRLDVEELRAAESELSLEKFFRAISNPRIEYALYYLYDHPTATLEQLADFVTGMEAASNDAIATPADRERTRIGLYHIALPKLDELGYVEFDIDDCTVSRADIPPTAYALLGIEE